MRRLQRFIPHSYWLIGVTAVLVLGSVIEMVYRALTVGPSWLALLAGFYLFGFLGGAVALVMRVPRDRL